MNSTPSPTRVPVPMRFAIVGAGSISQAHRVAFLEHPDRLQLAAVCDVNRSAAEQFV